RSGRVLALLNPNSVVLGQIPQGLQESAGPANRGLHGSFRLTESKQNFFRTLRKQSRSGLHALSLAAGAGFDDYHSTDRVAIAFRSAQTKSDRRRKVFS